MAIIVRLDVLMAERKVKSIDLAERLGLTPVAVSRLKTGKIKADLICLADEKFDPEETMVIFDPVDTWKKTKVLSGTYELRELLVPVIKDGKSVYKSPSVMELRDYCKQEQNTLWDESRRFVNPQKVYVDLSQSLYDMKKALLEEMSEKEL